MNHVPVLAGARVLAGDAGHIGLAGARQALAAGAGGFLSRCSPHRLMAAPPGVRSGGAGPENPKGGLRLPPTVAGTALARLRLGHGAGTTPAPAGEPAVTAPAFDADGGAFPGRSA